MREVEKPKTFDDLLREVDREMRKQKRPRNKKKRMK
jgi:hypothetical protein